MRDLNIQITVDGHPYPDGFMPENIRSARALKALPDDVFIVTYPKCGTTWVQHIVCQLMIEDYQLKPGKELFTWTPMIEFSGAAAALQRQRPRILKSHFFYRDCPKDPNAKYIFVTRNPKDAVVSAFHMTINQRREDYANISFDEFFDMFMEGKYSYGSYFDYHKEWLQHLQFHNALVVKYEDMIRDLKGAIVQIGEFLGGKAKEVIEDCAKLDKIVEDSTFSAMRKDQHRWIPNVLKGPDLFMRKGTPRDWKNYFTKKQSDQLDKEFAMHFKGIIAEHWWKEEMKWED